MANLPEEPLITGQYGVAETMTLRPHPPPLSLTTGSVRGYSLWLASLRHLRRRPVSIGMVSPPQRGQKRCVCGGEQHHHKISHAHHTLVAHAHVVPVQQLGCLAAVAHALKTSPSWPFRADVMPPLFSHPSHLHSFHPWFILTSCHCNSPTAWPQIVHACADPPAPALALPIQTTCHPASTPFTLASRHPRKNSRHATVTAPLPGQR